MNKIIPEFKFNLNILEDEKHIAAALYLLHKGIALRQSDDFGWPELHGCLRDAAMHCELARQYWTKEQMEEMRRVESLLFGKETKNEKE